MMNEKQQDCEAREQVRRVLHDLSAPLRSMGGLLHLLKQTRGEEELHKYLPALEKCYRAFDQRLCLLMHRFHGRGELSERIELFALLRHIIESLQYLPGAGQVIFSIADHTHKPFYGPWHLITSVFQNLMEHSMKHRRKTDHRLHIDLQDDPRGACIIISDNGPGMPEEQQMLKHIYGAGGNPSAQDMGLYYAQSILEQLNGRLSYSSSSGEGNTFTVYIPSEEGRV